MISKLEWRQLDALLATPGSAALRRAADLLRRRADAGGKREMLADCHDAVAGVEAGQNVDTCRYVFNHAAMGIIRAALGLGDAIGHPRAAGENERGGR
ncbi:MAG: hypothetical protein NTX87_02430 [Planctomycetota bacterium]|nr:hypothetical protein [Planctomycetota bacterium]